MRGGHGCTCATRDGRRRTCIGHVKIFQRCIRCSGGCFSAPPALTCFSSVTGGDTAGATEAISWDERATKTNDEEVEQATRKEDQDHDVDKGRLLDVFAHGLRRKYAFGPLTKKWRWMFGRSAHKARRMGSCWGPSLKKVGTGIKFGL
eukprot:symbB.v1.2.020463.t1/scaffold1728.1/size104513/3